MPLYRDRSDAGKQLASQLIAYARSHNPIVLALPRGGVPVGYEVAKALGAPLDVYIVRKIGVPGYPELAMGAVATDGSYVVDASTIESLGITPGRFHAALEGELVELKRREAAYRDGRPKPELAGRYVIVVDDGLATGASMYSAIAALRQCKPAAIAVAVPVAPVETCRMLATVADQVFCPHQPAYFGSVGFYYDNFRQVGDDEVRELLARAASQRATWKVA